MDLKKNVTEAKIVRFDRKHEVTAAHKPRAHEFV